ncbi:MAG: PASTA domain-containing protein [Nitrospirae bacterium]|nr:PASTA domain-containing protein [Nitrospirota bacterium]
MQKIKRILFYLFWFTLLSVLSGYITLKLLHEGRTIIVPNLKAISLNEAMGLAKNIGASLAVMEEAYDLHIPEGYIISQDIPAGTSIKGKAEIKVTLSKGVMPYFVPSVIGNTVDEAKKIFHQNDIVLSNIISVFSREVDKGRIIAQKPHPQEKTDELVTLIVSKGTYSVIYYCPSFKGMSNEDALTLVEELGLKVEIEGKGEMVKAQMPEPGTLINASSNIWIQLEGRSNTDDKDSSVNTVR